MERWRIAGTERSHLCKYSSFLSLRRLCGGEFGAPSLDSSGSVGPNRNLLDNNSLETSWLLLSCF